MDFKFYEFKQPYYSLIKAISEDEALYLYNRHVSSEDGEEETYEEVPYDYAVAVYSRAISEDGNMIPLEEALKDLRSETGLVMLVDFSLI